MIREKRSNYNAGLLNSWSHWWKILEQVLSMNVPYQAETARPLCIPTLLPQSSDTPGKGVTSAWWLSAAGAA